MSYTCETCNKTMRNSSKYRHWTTVEHVDNSRIELEEKKNSGSSVVKCNNCALMVLDVGKNRVKHFRECPNRCCVFCYDCLISFRSKCEGCRDDGCLDNCSEPYVNLVLSDTKEVVSVCAKTLTTECKGRCNTLISADSKFLNICATCLVDNNVQDDAQGYYENYCNLCNDIIYNSNGEGSIKDFNECESCGSQICFDCLDGEDYGEKCQLCQ